MSFQFLIKMLIVSLMTDGNINPPASSMMLSFYYELTDLIIHLEEEISMWSVIKHGERFLSSSFLPFTFTRSNVNMLIM